MIWIKDVKCPGPRSGSITKREVCSYTVVLILESLEI